MTDMDQLSDNDDEMDDSPPFQSKLFVGIREYFLPISEGSILLHTHIDTGTYAYWFLTKSLFLVFLQKKLRNKLSCPKKIQKLDFS